MANKVINFFFSPGIGRARTLVKPTELYEGKLLSNTLKGYHDESMIPSGATFCHQKGRRHTNGLYQCINQQPCICWGCRSVTHGWRHHNYFREPCEVGYVVPPASRCRVNFFLVLRLKARKATQPRSL
jgi:hypothetical protein